MAEEIVVKKTVQALDELGQWLWVHVVAVEGESFWWTFQSTGA